MTVLAGWCTTTFLRHGGDWQADWPLIRRAGLRQRQFAAYQVDQRPGALATLGAATAGGIDVTRLAEVWRSGGLPDLTIRQRVAEANVHGDSSWAVAELSAAGHIDTGR
jgi:hypothetical protein